MTQRDRSFRDVDVSDTGNATAPGGYANSGLHVGDVSLITISGGPRVRSAYLEQVRRIAPAELYDRHEELAELATFGTDAQAGQYVWWRAPAWAGKSALMAWFVLCPPPGVQVVSFFVTARYAGQSDRAAFVDVVMEQLCDLLEQPLPAYLTDATKESHLLALFAEAASWCQQTDQRLVLVVDGIDEDSGVTAGADAHSIAAILPAAPPSGMRIVVSGRPSPPVPTDVPDSHPLRDPVIVRTLGTSPSAEVVRVDAQRELTRLLHGTPAEQDLLGLLAAAGGGLSGADLAELTSWSRWEVDQQLGAVAARTFSSRGGHWRADTQVYMLGHETLQQDALNALGPTKLESYRQRLHAWADDYRDREWPPQTPEYLLRGYHNMLKADGDLKRIVRYATDPARQTRMLDLSGGDAAVLAEINSAQDMIVLQDDPDLIGMLRLAMHRDHLTERNSHIPVKLPSVWARIGQFNRAESLAMSITEIGERAQALGMLAEVAVSLGHRERAVEFLGSAEAIIDQIAYPPRRVEILSSLAETASAIDNFEFAEAIARSIADAGERARTLTTIAERAAASGELKFAEMIARSIVDLEEQARALTSVAKLVAAAGDHDRATELLSLAETNILLSSDHYVQALVLRLVAKAKAAIGGHEDAVDLVSQAETMAACIPHPRERVHVLGLVAEATASIGDLDRAKAIADSITDPTERINALCSLVGTSAISGDNTRASEFLECAGAATDAVRGVYERVSLLGLVAEAAGAVGEFARAAELLNRAETMVGTIQAAHEQVIVMMSMVKVAGVIGDVGRALAFLSRTETILDTIPSTYYRFRFMRSLAKTAVTIGALDIAERIVRSITDFEEQSRALTDLAEAWALVDEVGHAATLLMQAEARARSTADSERHDQVVTMVVGVAAKAGLLDYAKTIADSITDQKQHAQALSAVAEAAAEAGQLDYAKTIASSIVGEWRTRASQAIAKFAATNGDLETAREIAETINDPGDRAYALISVAEVAHAIPACSYATEGLLDVAAEVADSIADIDERVEILTALAEAAAGAGDSSRVEQVLDTFMRLAEHADNAYDTVMDSAVLAALAVDNTDRAEKIAGTIPDLGQQAWALGAVAEAVAIAGNLDRAEAIADSVRTTDRAWALSLVAAVSAAAGYLDRATRLFDRAESITRSIAHPKKRGEILDSVAALLAAVDPDRAEAIARQAAGLGWPHHRALESIVKSAAIAGDFERVNRIAYSMSDAREVVHFLMIQVANPAAQCRARTMVQILRLDSWQHKELVQALFDIVPDALVAIMAELNLLAPA